MVRGNEGGLTGTGFGQISRRHRTPEAKVPGSRRGHVTVRTRESWRVLQPMVGFSSKRSWIDRYQKSISTKAAAHLKTGKKYVFRFKECNCSRFLALVEKSTKALTWRKCS
uniref:Uncharacterized protein n=1 Tax=Arundo donax TaxID=35708 RepID=A0A0A9B163_ARUDO